MMQMFGNSLYQFGRDQRFIALHIHHNGVIRPPVLLNHFGNAIRAADVTIFSQACLEAVSVYCIDNCGMISGDPDLLRAALRRLFGYPYHHGLPSN
jgi:hypothetical protein